MKNKFNIDDKVIYEGELYIVFGIDKMNRYLVYKIDPVKEDGKEYVVSEEEIKMYKPFEELSKDELLAFIKTYDNYVEVCFGMKQKPKSSEEYYNSITYRVLCKEKAQTALSSKYKGVSFDTLIGEVGYKYIPLEANDIVKNKTAKEYGIIKVVLDNKYFIHYVNGLKCWEYECDLIKIEQEKEISHIDNNIQIYKDFLVGDLACDIRLNRDGKILKIYPKMDCIKIDYSNTIAFNKSSEIAKIEKSFDKGNNIKPTHISSKILDNDNCTKPKTRFVYGNRVYNIMTLMEGTVKAISKYQLDKYFVQYVNGHTEWVEGDMLKIKR